MVFRVESLVSPSRWLSHYRGPVPRQNLNDGKKDERGGTARQCTEARSSASVRAGGIRPREGAGARRLGCPGMVSSWTVPAEVHIC